MDNKKVFIIAELSANHNNDYDLAVKSIEAMAKSGADAVKVQTYTADSMTLDVNTEYFGPRKEGLWKGRRLYELYQEAGMPYEWQPKLQKIAHELGLVFFSTPFDRAAVDFLEKMNNPIYKIASMEINDLPLIEYAASKGKPMIISTGAGDEADIKNAIAACRKVGNDDITMLKCTAQYPAPVDAANLLTIPDMRERFGVKVGLSDHTMGHTVPVVAVSLGARVVEKHFILDRSLGGPDSAFSMEPDEFAAMVTAIREAESALGEVSYAVAEKDKLRRRSLFVSKNIAAGEAITTDNVRSIRPGYGLPPGDISKALGKKALRDLPAGTPLSWEDLG